MDVDDDVLTEECPVTHGDHDWKEGGARDVGRYHCQRCMLCMEPMAIVWQMRRLRAILRLKVTRQKDEVQTLNCVCGHSRFEHHDRGHCTVTVYDNGSEPKDICPCPRFTAYELPKEKKE